MKDAATTTERATLPRSRLLPTLFDNLDSFAETPEGVAKLRELILELAYSGKGAEWQTKSIAEIATTVHPGAACGKQHQVNDGYVHLRTHNVSTDGKLTFDLIVRVDPAKIDEKKAHLRKGDIIFNNTNSQELVGKTCVVDKDYDYAFSNHLTLVRVNNDVEPAFVVGYFRLLLRRGFFFQLCNRWIGQAGINTKVLKEIEVPLPPLSEQRRIVSKVDGLMSLCDELESRGSERVRLRERASRSCLDSLVSSRSRRDLSSAWQRLSDHFEVLYDTPETLAQLRQSILQLAVQGKLVPQDPNDEPAEELLARIDEMRAELVAAKQIKKSKPFASIDETEIPFAIPDSWCWARIGQTARLVEYGTSQKASENGNGVPVLRMNSIQDGRVILDGLKYVPETLDELPSLFLETDDLLFNRTNSYELVGKTGIFKGPSEQYTFASYLIRVRPFDGVCPEYVNLAMNAGYYRTTQIEPELTQQCGQANFNGTKMKNSLMPLPPSAEQKRIVAKVDQLLSQCDELSARLRDRQSATHGLLTATIHQILRRSESER